VPALVRLPFGQDEMTKQLPTHALVTAAATATATAATDDLVVRLVARRGEFLDYLRRRVRSGADAEDLLQQALMRASGKVSQLRDPDLLFPWFYQVLRRTLADHHARWAKQEGHLDELSSEVEAATDEEAATCGCSLGLLPTLKPEYADILRRVDLDDMSIVSVAEAMGITANNATVRLHRARKALRQALVDLCGTTTARACGDCGCDG
jgi:RNA polymerase sigma factor (sigma-70 family)